LEEKVGWHVRKERSLGGLKSQRREEEVPEGNCGHLGEEKSDQVP